MDPDGVHLLDLDRFGNCLGYPGIPLSSCFHQNQELETDAGKAQPFLKALKKQLPGEVGEMLILDLAE